MFERPSSKMFYFKIQQCSKITNQFARRWIKDLPHIIRRQLQDVREFPEESLEKYAERAQELTTDGYPGTPDSFIQIVATDAFLKGWSDRKAALTAMDKDPTDQDTALQYVKSAVTNQRVILGIKKPDIGVKGVVFQESDTEGETELMKNH